MGVVGVVMTCQIVIQLLINLSLKYKDY